MIMRSRTGGLQFLTCPPPTYPSRSWLFLTDAFLTRLPLIGSSLIRPLLTGPPLTRLGLAGLTLCCATFAHGAEGNDKAAIVNRAIDDVFRPATGALADSAERLSNTLDDSCSGETVREQFIDTVQRFSEAEYYRLGAMNQDNRAERLFFWPDRKGIGQRQLSQLMSDPARSEIDAATLADKSVALQGLPALERILFDTARAPDAKVPEADCVVARAIAGNMANIAGEIEQDWNADDGVAAALINHSDTSLYRSDDESIAALLTLVETGLVAVHDKKIVPVVGGLEDTGSIIKTAPLWRSDQTLANLRGNLAGLQSLLVSVGLADAADASDDLDFEFRTAGTMLDAAEDALVDGDTETARSRLEALSSIVAGLNDQVLGSVAPALGVETGFNSGDGD